MASKVMVKIPVASFGVNNSNKTKGTEIVSVRQPEMPTTPPLVIDDKPKTLDGCRSAQLEQNIRFLQEQHQLMLAGLHNEIDTLRNRNRELQFQLVFAKGTLPSSPSSPEDETKSKVYTSPKPINITPLQIELLEKEMGELKFQLQEAESRNIYLSAIVDEQKKKLERYERDREKERDRAIQPDPELLRKLDDAETIIRRLRRENSDLRREAAALAPAAPYQAYKEAPAARGRGGRQRGYSRGNAWFPPLNAPAYWQQAPAGRAGDAPRDGAATLPNLQNGGQQFGGRRGTNNNHYHDGGRKYRGNNKGKPS